MTKYDALNTLARKIAEEFCKVRDAASKVPGAASFEDGKFFTEYPNIEDLKFPEGSKFIIVLGLNPSSSGNKDGVNLFGYLPPFDNEAKNTALKSIKKKRLEYAKYFKPIIELFGQVNYYPLWFHKTYLDKTIEKAGLKASVKLDEEEIQYLNQYAAKHQNDNCYIVYSEILHYAETDSKQVKPHFDNQALTNLIKQYIIDLIAYFKPTAIYANSAFVSKFLFDSFERKGPETQISADIEINNCRVFLGSMLSNGVMDTYSQIRLLEDIKSHLEVSK